MQQIPNVEMKRHRSYDEKGYVFEWQNRIYRAVYPAHEEDVRALFTSGLVAELVSAKLFPATELTDLATEDARLVVMHERIPVITLPSEWSFSMLRAAASTVIEVNRIARKYGYQTGDAHGFNATFKNGRPLYLDLGSFIHISNDIRSGARGWRPYGEFCRSMLAPLRLWSRGDSFLARQALYGEQLPMATYWRHAQPLARLVPQKWLRMAESGYYRWKAPNSTPVERFKMLISVSARRERAGRAQLQLDRDGLLPLLTVDLDKLAR